MSEIFIIVGLENCPFCSIIIDFFKTTNFNYKFINFYNLISFIDKNDTNQKSLNKITSISFPIILYKNYDTYNIISNSYIKELLLNKNKINKTNLFSDLIKYIHSFI